MQDVQILYVVTAVVVAVLVGWVAYVLVKRPRFVPPAPPAPPAEPADAKKAEPPATEADKPS